jgi:hypothetical protein
MKSILTHTVFVILINTLIIYAAGGNAAGLNADHFCIGQKDCKKEQIILSILKLTIYLFQI